MLSFSPSLALWVLLSLVDCTQLFESEQIVCMAGDSAVIAIARRTFPSSKTFLSPFERSDSELRMLCNPVVRLCELHLHCEVLKDAYEFLWGEIANPGAGQEGA